jgi:hypothetical protein
VSDHNTLGDLAIQVVDHVAPYKVPLELFHHYSLPNYDAGKLPMLESGHSIKSGKLRIPDGAVLLSKLNPKHPKVWRIPTTMGQQAIASTEFLVLQPRTGITLNALYAACLNPYFLRALAAKATGTSSSHQRVRPEDLLATELNISAEPAALAKIGDFIAALDEKIELNHRMSTTLEAVARALFQGWFVDFDPVRAKAEGRQLVGMDAATAELIPDSFEDSSLGQIPKGWRVGTMGSVTRTRNEKVGTATAQVLSAVATGRLIHSDEYFSKQVFSASIQKYLVVRQWDFAYNPSRINIGSIGLLEEDLIGAVSPVYEVVTPQPTFHWFIEKSLRLPFIQDQIRGLCSGSVRQSLRLSDFLSIQLVIPPREVVHAYNRAWELQRSKIVSLSIENMILTHVRDNLLPKLLSGELAGEDVTA